MNNSSADNADTGDPTGLDFRLDVFGSMDPRIARALLDVPSVARAVEKVHAERYLELTSTRWRLTTTTDPSHLDRVWIPERLLEAVRVVRVFVDRVNDPFWRWPDRAVLDRLYAEVEYLLEWLEYADASHYDKYIEYDLDDLHTTGADLTELGFDRFDRPNPADEVAATALTDIWVAAGYDPVAEELSGDFEVGALLATLDVHGIPVTREAVEDAYRLDVTAFLEKWLPTPWPITGLTFGTAPGGEA